MNADSLGASAKTLPSARTDCWYFGRDVIMPTSTIDTPLLLSTLKEELSNVYLEKKDLKNEK